MPSRVERGFAFKCLAKNVLYVKKVRSQPVAILAQAPPPRGAWFECDVSPELTEVSGQDCGPVEQRGRCQRCGEGRPRKRRTCVACQRLVCPACIVVRITDDLVHCRDHPPEPEPEPPDRAAMAEHAPVPQAATPTPAQVAPAKLAEEQLDAVLQSVTRPEAVTETLIFVVLRENLLREVLSSHSPGTPAGAAAGLAESEEDGGDFLRELLSSHSPWAAY